MDDGERACYLLGHGPDLMPEHACGNCNRVQRRCARPAGRGNRASFLGPRAWLRIVLLAADRMSNTEIAERVGMSRRTVIALRDRYFSSGLEGL
jgi:Homeodomain-like domain